MKKSMKYKKEIPGVEQRSVQEKDREFIKD